MDLVWTFDDGPSEYTAAVLDLLRGAGLSATFFCVGQRALEHPDLARRIAREGHVLGSHTSTHPHLPACTDDELADEILSGHREVAQAAGVEPTTFRAPYGETDARVYAACAKLGVEGPAGWDIDPRDWERPGAAAIADHIRTRAMPGAVVLLHDGRGDRSQTVEALRILLS